MSSPYLKEMPDKFVVKFIHTFFDEMQKTNKNYQIPSHVFFNLSKSQLMMLKDAIPGLINKDEYLQVWFSHNYDEHLLIFQKQDLTISEKDEKRKLMLKIMKDLDHLKTTKTKAMRRKMLR